MTEPRCVLTVTLNPSLDKSAETDRVIPDTKLRCGPMAREPGGGGINVSRVLHRLGQPTTAAFISGGVEGDEVRDLLDAEGVDQCPICIGGTIRESFMVVESTSGQQFRFAFPGPRLVEHDVARCREAIETAAKGSGLIVFSGSLPPGVPSAFYRDLANVLATPTRRIILDTSGHALRQALEGEISLIKPNLREFEALVGHALPDDAAIDRAALELVSASAVGHIAVSLGAAGVALAGRDRVVRIAAPTVPIRSRVGAGDSALAGIVYGLAQDLDVREAAEIGMAAGSATVMSEGSRLCRKEDVAHLYEGMTGRRFPGQMAESGT